MTVENMNVEQCHSPPPELGKRERFRIFLRNSETGQFMGRTGASWAKILLCCAVLCGFFGASLATVFYQTENSNPGLGIEPMTTDSDLIYYKASDVQSYLHWTKQLDAFLSHYGQTSMTHGVADTRVLCDYDNPPLPGKVCLPDVELWQPCSQHNSYNYQKSAPCIFLKLNKIFGWMPQIYNDTSKLPSNMPADLKSHITNVQSQNRKTVNTLWVSCEGKSPVDVENIGPIQYIPQRGFPGYYFPFTNTTGYLSPLVAVLFERPMRGILINIECKLWAQNIHHDRFGTVNFELMVD
ncbi:sodium/potassium-transporting ATPase subunit beta-2-like [Diprion similis]|uniref:sodium/potassium-transporting ATPase subunit beta-2-like n=1 Tax=Diprion similis TaxID=362088 RepID=UPI001EF8FBF7|nr:sodium/potassium-transporting ATPase subunit beta-2-like [Diprion similis]